MKSELKSLYKRLERIRSLHEQKQPKQLPTFLTFWGDGTPTDEDATYTYDDNPNALHIVTEWGSGALSDE